MEGIIIGIIDKRGGGGINRLVAAVDAGGLKSIPQLEGGIEGGISAKTVAARNGWDENDGAFLASQCVADHC